MEREMPLENQGVKKKKPARPQDRPSYRPTASAILNRVLKNLPDR